MQMSGAILIDKPPFITSYDVIRELKRLLKVQKVGHTGTLDPIATGLMILLLGAATKLADYFLKLNKVYNFTIRFGQETDTMDSEGTVIRECDYSKVEINVLKNVVRSFIGDIEQYPPAYSAVKYKGKPLYKYARKGQTVPIMKRKVKIINFSVDELSLPYGKFTAEVSSGTYIRSIAKSIGDAMGCCAHVTALRRLKIGNFSVEQAVQLHEIKRCSDRNSEIPDILINREILLKNIKQNNLLQS